MLDGDSVLPTQGHILVVQRDCIVQSDSLTQCQEHFLTAEERAIVNTLRKYDPYGRKVARRLLGMMDEVARQLIDKEDGAAR